MHLITSIPGTHANIGSGYPHGHGQVAHILSEHSPPIDDTSPIIAQSSALGNYGTNPDAWLTSEFVNSFRNDSQPVAQRMMPNIRVIYPSLNNVENSFYGILGGECLLYSGTKYKKNSLFLIWRKPNNSK